MFGLVLIGCGIFAVFNSVRPYILCHNSLTDTIALRQVYDYTSDAYGADSSSAIAAQGLQRNMLAGVSPLFATAFFHNLGSQWAGLLMALIATLLTPIPFVLKHWGPQLRRRSKVASQYTD